MKVTIVQHLHTTSPQSAEKKPVSIHDATSTDLPQGWKLRVLSRTKCDAGETYPRSRFLGLDFESGTPVVSVWV